MSEVSVKNLHGDKGLPSCKCSSWLDHWTVNKYGKNKDYEEYTCRCCSKKLKKYDMVGGHVKKIFGSDNSHYIVPLCKECNNSYNEKSFKVDESDLISANCNNCENK